VTATPRELAHASELRSALAELNNAAVASRPFVLVSSHSRDGRQPIEGLGDSTLTLERLDAALADAGEVLERCSA